MYDTLYCKKISSPKTPTAYPALQNADKCVSPGSEILCPAKLWQGGQLHIFYFPAKSWVQGRKDCQIALPKMFFPS